MLSTSNTTCLLKTSATVCGTLMAAPVAGCLYRQAIRRTAVPFNGVVYHSRLDARNRSYPSSSALNDMLVGLRRSLAGVVCPIHAFRRARSSRRLCPSAFDTRPRVCPTGLAWAATPSSTAL